jgi:uroporphyrinogen-III synthase
MIEGALAGFTVAVTAERRRNEMAALLERRGARVISAPAITIIPLIAAFLLLQKYWQSGLSAGSVKE